MPQAPADLRILPAQAHQVPLILSFIRKLAEYEKLSHEVIADGETLQGFLFGPRPPAEVIFAYLGERPVAFALFFTSFSTFVGRPGIYLEDLFVDEDCRGQGIGKALLQYLAKLTTDRNYGRLEWAVLDWNRPSIDFYESLGAKPMDQWTVYRLVGAALKDLAGRA
ncbi:MAG: GNAT family N-acetyltransferase [Acidobacteriota bacterium]|nr:GNAT family N-acetyltransferase [Acidobacteriota bacterium]